MVLMTATVYFGGFDVIRMILPIKPLSLNSLYICRGNKRYKTPEHRRYSRDLQMLMPNGALPEGKLAILIKAHLSNKAQDIDNIAKPIIDAIQSKYKRNDKAVYSICLIKKIVPKGQEHIVIHIEQQKEINKTQPERMTNNGKSH